MAASASEWIRLRVVAASVSEWIRLRVVAASVSEWALLGSLTLTATPSGS